MLNFRPLLEAVIIVDEDDLVFMRLVHTNVGHVIPQVSGPHCFTVYLKKIRPTMAVIKKLGKSYKILIIMIC